MEAAASTASTITTAAEDSTAPPVAGGPQAVEVARRTEWGTLLEEEAAGGGGAVVATPAPTVVAVGLTCPAGVAGEKRGRKGESWFCMFGRIRGGAVLYYWYRGCGVLLSLPECKLELGSR